MSRLKIPAFWVAVVLAVVFGALVLPRIVNLRLWLTDFIGWYQTTGLYAWLVEQLYTFRLWLADQIVNQDPQKPMALIEGFIGVLVSLVVLAIIVTFIVAVEAAACKLRTRGSRKQP